MENLRNGMDKPSVIPFCGILLPRWPSATSCMTILIVLFVTRSSSFLDKDERFHTACIISKKF